MYNLIILAGGFGTRMDSISDGIPKALMPVGKGVYLDLILEKVFENNVENVILSLYYRSELFNDYVDKSSFKNNIKIVIEAEPLGTGGAIKYAIETTKISSPFYVINGDTFSNIDLNKMMIEFLKSKYHAMIGISKVNDSSRFGAIAQKNGKILSFNEKKNGFNNWINNGHYIFTKEVFDSYNGKFSLEEDFFPKLIIKETLGSFAVNNDDFIDMGIPDDYNKICKIYNRLN